MSLLVLGISGVAVIAALLFVFRGGSAPGRGGDWTGDPSGEGQRLDEASRLRLALDEIEIDRASGTLSEPDYAALRATYQAALRHARTAAPAAGVADEAEALVARARAEQSACPACGPRPEPSPPYCSSCGLHLRACRGCGERPTVVGARFCSQCGMRLAA